jgi:HK97 family phage major capsid protein
MHTAEIKEALEKRRNLVAQAQAIHDKATSEKREMTADEDRQFDALMSEGDDWKKKADDWTAADASAKNRSDRLNTAREDLKKASNHGIDRNRFPASAVNGGLVDPFGAPLTFDKAFNAKQGRAIQGWARAQKGYPVFDAHEDAAAEMGWNVRQQEIDIQLPRNYAEVRNQYFGLRNALTTQTGALGGFATMGEGFVPALEMALLHYGPMARVADIIRTTTGEAMGWPTANDTGNSGRQIGEAAAVASTTDPAFAKKMWNAYKLTSDEVLVAYELLQDCAFDLATLLGAMLGERLGRILNTKATTGSGAGTFTGIVTAASVGKTAALANAIAADEIIDLEHSVDIAYRTGASYMFNDLICAALRKLKDGEGRYLWQQGMAGGQPDRLNNYPVVINNDMAASITNSAKTMLFGQLSKYKIRMVGAIRLYRLVERHRENDQDAFLAFLRADGGLLDAGVGPVKVLQQAA